MEDQKQITAALYVCDHRQSTTNHNDNTANNMKQTTDSVHATTTTTKPCKTIKESVTRRGAQSTWKLTSDRLCHFTTCQTRIGSIQVVNHGLRPINTWHGSGSMMSGQSRLWCQNKIRHRSWQGSFWGLSIKATTQQNRTWWKTLTCSPVIQRRLINLLIYVMARVKHISRNVELFL